MTKTEFVAKYKIDFQGVRDLEGILDDNAKDTFSEYLIKHKLKPDIEKGIEAGDFIQTTDMEEYTATGVVASIKGKIVVWCTNRKFKSDDLNNFKSVKIVAKKDTQEWETLFISNFGNLNYCSDTEINALRGSLRSLNVKEELLSFIPEVGSELKRITDNL